jgi:DNA recombination protein RmuC
MPVIMIIMGIAIGAIVVFLVSRVRVRACVEQVSDARVLVEQLRGERNQALAQVTSLHGQLSGDQQEAQQKLTDVRAELTGAQTTLATAQAELKAERNAHEERVAELRAVEANIDERVKAATAGALKDMAPQLVALAKAQLGKDRAEAKAEIDAEHLQVAQLVGGVEKTLTQMAGRLDEIERDRIKGRTELAAQLQTMRESQSELMAGTQALVGALGRPHVRGRWGEIQLRNIIEAAGMLRHVDFDEQCSLPGDEGVLRPDACVHMPGGRDVVVDAKVPLSAYLEWISATDEAERERLLVEHARHVRAHLNSLDSKAYWERLNCSPDFVVMFIPNDQVLLAAMEADKSLATDIHRKQVVIATPMNLMALLRIIALGWRQEVLAANATEVEKLGRDLYKRLGVFGRHLSGLGKKIGTLVKGYNEASGSFNRMVLPGARRLSELGAVAPDTALNDLDEVTQIPREMQLGEEEGVSGGRALPAGPGEEPAGLSVVPVVEDDDEPEGGAGISVA